MRHVRVLGKNLLQIRLPVADISDPSVPGGGRSLRGCFGRARSGALRTLRGRGRVRVPEVLPMRCRSPRSSLMPAWAGPQRAGEPIWRQIGDWLAKSFSFEEAPGERGVLGVHQPSSHLPTPQLSSCAFLRNSRGSFLLKQAV